MPGNGQLCDQRVGAADSILGGRAGDLQRMEILGGNQPSWNEATLLRLAAQRMMALKRRQQELQRYEGQQNASSNLTQLPEADRQQWAGQPHGGTYQQLYGAAYHQPYGGSSQAYGNFRQSVPRGGNQSECTEASSSGNATSSMNVRFPNVDNRTYQVRMAEGSESAGCLCWSQLPAPVFEPSTVWKAIELWSGPKLMHRSLKPVTKDVEDLEDCVAPHAEETKREPSLQSVGNNDMGVQQGESTPSDGKRQPPSDSTPDGLEGRTPHSNGIRELVTDQATSVNCKDVGINPQRRKIRRSSTQRRGLRSGQIAGVSGLARKPERMRDWYKLPSDADTAIITAASRPLTSEEMEKLESRVVQFVREKEQQPHQFVGDELHCGGEAPAAADAGMYDCGRPHSGSESLSLNGRSDLKGFEMSESRCFSHGARCPHAEIVSSSAPNLGSLSLSSCDNREFLHMSSWFQRNTFVNLLLNNPAVAILLISTLPPSTPWMSLWGGSLIEIVDGSLEGQSRRATLEEPPVAEAGTDSLISTQMPAAHKVNLDLLVHSLETVNSILEKDVCVSEAFLRQYVSCGMEIHCHLADYHKQNKWIRLVCVFLQRLLQQDKLQRIPDLIPEIQSFCVENTRVREAAALFRLLKKRKHVQL